MNCKQNKAFTLAEVLITLAVIGVVASISIPSLMNSTNDQQLQVAAKKAYSTISRAYLKAVSENGGGFGLYSYGTEVSYTKFNALKTQLQKIKDCPHDSGAFGKCWATEGVGLKNHSPTNCALWANSSVGQNRNPSFVTPDGMFFMLYSYDDTTGTDRILVDINGDKGPNDFGKDVFQFEIHDTNILPETYVCNILKHNDGTDVEEEEFIAPFK